MESAAAEPRQAVLSESQVGPQALRQELSLQAQQVQALQVLLSSEALAPLAWEPPPAPRVLYQRELSASREPPVSQLEAQDAERLRQPGLPVSPLEVRLQAPPELWAACAQLSRRFLLLLFPPLPRLPRRLPLPLDRESFCELSPRRRQESSSSASSFL